MIATAHRGVAAAGAVGDAFHQAQRRCPRLEQDGGDQRQPDAEEQVARRQLQQRVEAVLARFRRELSERDRVLLDERILSEAPLTLQEIGDRFGTTREAARQAEVRLMTRLRAFVKQELGDLGQIRIGPD